ncbi:MAG: gliding motility protein GldL [Prevotellaceae bacterium]|nr:gliding motility protein GldL [Prevotellaceae bacterium]
MGKKRKSLNAIQGWLHTKSGQTFLNIAYSWGASIVILGALFKLTHIAGADLMLFIGMGTEVIVFFISGFDVPWEDDETPAATQIASTELPEGEDDDSSEPVVVGGNIGGGTIIIGGGAPAANYNPDVHGEATDGGSTPIDAAALAASISSVQIPQHPGMTPEMQEATAAYVNQLNELTDILKQVAEQSARLTRDSEEMETMNRTLTGINRFYEMQLRSVGQQSATIDDVNTQTKRLAEQLEELNGVYARMVEALKMKVG